MLAGGRGISIIRIALLPAERRPTLTVPFVGGGDVDVALAQPLARTQTRAGLPEQARVILRGRERERDCTVNPDTLTAVAAPADCT